MKKAIVIGAGPAGLIAAEALSAEGIDVPLIYSAPVAPQFRPDRLSMNQLVKKSELYGAQFLHGPLHGSRVKHSEPFDVVFKVDGMPHEYERKVYGPGHALGSSADKYKNGYTMLGWDIREAYNVLWDLWNHALQPVFLTPEFLGGMIAETQEDGFHIVSTVPRPLTCAFREEHAFRSQNIYAVGDPDPEEFWVNVADDTIVMNGEPSPSWYRAASIQGHLTVEWPGDRRPSVNAAVLVKKPLHHTCTCWSMAPVTFLGRYGAWQKSVLLHEVYDDAKRLGARLRVQP